MLICFLFLIFIDSLHTQGPLDGSLYATILKSPKSPLKSPTFPPAFISNIVNNNHQQNSNTSVVTSTPKPERVLSTQSLISPPPEFSNKKLVEIKDLKTPNRSYTSTPSYEEIQIPSRSTSRDTNRYYQTTPRPSSSLSAAYQPETPIRSSSVSRAATLNPSNQYINTIDTYNNYGATVQNGNARNHLYQDGRESVKSQLTLSMDSGISSSGIANSQYLVSF